MNKTYFLIKLIKTETITILTHNVGPQAIEYHGPIFSNETISLLDKIPFDDNRFLSENEDGKKLKIINEMKEKVNSYQDYVTNFNKLRDLQKFDKEKKIIEDYKKNMNDKNMNDKNTEEIKRLIKDKKLNKKDIKEFLNDLRKKSPQEIVSKFFDKFRFKFSENSFSENIKLVKKFNNKFLGKSKSEEIDADIKIFQEYYSISSGPDNIGDNKKIIIDDNEYYFNNCDLYKIVDDDLINLSFNKDHHVQEYICNFDNLFPIPEIYHFFEKYDFFDSKNNKIYNFDELYEELKNDIFSRIKIIKTKKIIKSEITDIYIINIHGRIFSSTSSARQIFGGIIIYDYLSYFIKEKYCIIAGDFNFELKDNDIKKELESQFDQNSKIYKFLKNDDNERNDLINIILTSVDNFKSKIINLNYVPSNCVTNHWAIKNYIHYVPSEQNNIKSCIDFICLSKNFEGIYNINYEIFNDYISHSLNKGFGFDHAPVKLTLTPI